MSNSRLPTSAQCEPHARLLERLSIHERTEWLQPIRSHSRQALDRLTAQLAAEPRPIILDSGCGTGWACVALAQRYPNHWIIGIDRSKARLSKAPEVPNNVFLMRAELADVWRLMVEQNWSVERHYVLYPNPYPKASQLQRRWHGHPAWPFLLQVCDCLIMRTNVSVYAREWHQALHYCGYTQATLNELDLAQTCQQPLTAFEKKYAASGHPLFEVCT